MSKSIRILSPNQIEEIITHLNKLFTIYYALGFPEDAHVIHELISSLKEKNKK